MNRSNKLGMLQVLIIPGFFVSILIIPTLNSWFGLADDHLFAEAIRSTDGSFEAIFRYYFNLQPWSHSPRFNPSELLGWTLETSIFGSNALGWRIIQLIALLASSITIGISIRKISGYLGYSANKTNLSTILGQGVFLALPFWSETIGRIGAPETFASVSLSLILLNAINMVIRERITFNLFWLCLNTVILVGFKENLIVIGISSMMFQVCYLLQANREIQKRIIISLLIQLTSIALVIVGFLPNLLDSGQEVNGAGIGLSRIVITKWIVVPIFSFCILLISQVVNRNQQQTRNFHTNIFICSLISIEYFIMAGRLSGHYGFLSSILLSTQVLVLLHKIQKFKKSVVGVLLTFSILGISFNTSSTLDYLNRTNRFKQELNNLRDILQRQNINTVVINVGSLEEYEAVSSVTSFTSNEKAEFFLQVSDSLPEGLLKTNLLKYSNYGFKEWHLEPLTDWQNMQACISIQFSERARNDSCKYAQQITWLAE